MKVVRLSIANFRGVKAAEIHFEGHTLMVGANNVGKSTVLEALDLVLGPDRLSRFPPVEEFDFHNAKYLGAPAEEGGAPQSIPIRIEVVLTELTEEVENRCGGHIEFWKPSERRLLDQGEADVANPPDTVSCLRLETIARYDLDEDEFEAQTWFSHSPDAPPGELTSVRKDVKRLFGFLYLRTLRTGSRALSLERGSLLDLILRLKGVRTGLWEKAISRLKAMDMDADASDLNEILEDIESRLSRYVPANAPGRATKLHVSQLTREHLRKTMSFFLAMSADQDPVPFQQVGTGTLNTLVLALLSFIADLKPETVIFAMEEPEIAVPPHTQRRIADYLLQKTTQAFVTSHSPFVIERFEPTQTLLLTRADDGTVTTTRVSDATGLKDNDYKRYARRGLTECMLGRGAVVAEGVTEFHALPIAARRLEEANGDLLPLDIAGVTFFDADSDGSIPKFGAFFKALGLKTFSFYDHKTRKPEEKQKFTAAFDVDCEHQYAGFEELIAVEMPANRLWSFLSALRDAGENGQVGIPAVQPSDDEIRTVAKKALASGKGAGWAARLFEECDLTELPGTVTDFLMQVYQHFPKPPDLAPAGSADEAPAAPAAAKSP
ncbi:MAG TPA: AAA family ATPase [Noviherbaspirillum sp.]